jgi:hypothetical protein
MSYALLMKKGRVGCVYGIGNACDKVVIPIPEVMHNGNI